MTIVTSYEYTWGLDFFSLYCSSSPKEVTWCWYGHEHPLLSGVELNNASWTNVVGRPSINQLATYLQY